MISKILTYLFNSLDRQRKRQEELYLSSALDLADLERRQRKLMQGNDRNNFL